VPPGKKRNGFVKKIIQPMEKAGGAPKRLKRLMWRTW